MSEDKRKSGNDNKEKNMDSKSGKKGEEEEENVQQDFDLETLIKMTPRKSRTERYEVPHPPITIQDVHTETSQNELAKNQKFLDNRNKGIDLSSPQNQKLKMKHSSVEMAKDMTAGIARKKSLLEGSSKQDIAIGSGKSKNIIRGGEGKCKGIAIEEEQLQPRNRPRYDNLEKLPIGKIDDSDEECDPKGTRSTKRKSGGSSDEEYDPKGTRSTKRKSDNMDVDK